VYEEKKKTHPFTTCNSHFILSDLTKYASHVYVLVRRGELRASKIMAKRLLNHPKIVSLSRSSHTQLQIMIYLDGIVEHSCD
jgi:hypothetical protein